VQTFARLAKIWEIEAKAGSNETAEHSDIRTTKTESFESRLF